MPAKKRRPDFSLIAPLYQWLEHLAFGTALQKRRCAFVADVSDARNGLILGDGDARFTEKLLKSRSISEKYPHCLTLLDNSSAMLRLARKRLAAYEKLQAVIDYQWQDIRSAHLTGMYDLVTSHYFLDCFSVKELKDWMPRVAGHMRPGAKWLISEFSRPATHPWRSLGGLLIRCLYIFFRIVAGLQANRLPDHQAVLRGCGFSLIKSEKNWKGLLVSELWLKEQS